MLPASHTSLLPLLIFCLVPTASVKNTMFVTMCGSIGPICPSLVPKDPNLCDLGAKCPIKPGDTNTVKVEIPISKSYPQVNLFSYYSEILLIISCAI